MSTIKINFDSAGIPRTPTLILARKNGTKIGGFNAEGIVIKDSFQDPCEITFTVYEANCNIWDDIVDFKFVWCKEWDKWFEINSVEVEESDSKKKNVSCMEVSQSELSQIMLFGIEINTEDDIAREDYTSPTIIYDSVHPENSLLNRIMEKAVNFRILHVDSSIANLQRTFKFDDVSLYDAFGQIAEEVDCIFVYANNTRSDGTINRGISVYDMQDYCSNCKHRGYDFVNGVCPECGSSGNLVKLRYGDDTTVFVTSDELGESIKLSADTDSVKNCFKLTAGDDLMTATIRNCNANGTDYLWYLDDCIQTDMSTELKAAISNYQNTYNDWQNNHVYGSGVSWQTNYNYVVTKYRAYDPDIPKIPSTVQGYPMLMECYYNAVDLYHYIKSSLMPAPNISKPTADEVLETVEAVRYVCTDDLSVLSPTTANNIIVNNSKYIADPRYKIEVEDTTLEEDESGKWWWRGKFKVTDDSDETNTASSSSYHLIQIDDDYEVFLKNKIFGIVNEHAVSDVNIDDMFVLETNPTHPQYPFKMTDDEFKEVIKGYSLNEISNIQKICQSCIDIMIEQDIPSMEQTTGSPTLYYTLYTPYKRRLSFIEEAIKDKETDLAIVSKTLETIDMYVSDTHYVLDLQRFLGEDLWKEFVLYKREQKYSNDNYVSDGLENSELIEKAQEFLTAAKKELYKSATLQHSISTTLRNLLVIDKFQPIIGNFKTGNWIRIKADNEIHRLRLLSFELDYDNLENLSVEFSDVLKTLDGEVDQQSIMDKMTAISTSYNYTQYQAEKGIKGKETVDEIVDNGIDVASIPVSNTTDNQCQIWDENGILLKKFDPDTGDYDPHQMKIVNSTLSITDNNWGKCKTAVGFFRYTVLEPDPITGEEVEVEKMGYGINAETIRGKFIIGENLEITNLNGSVKFDGNGLIVSNADGSKKVYITPKEEDVFKITNGEDTILGFNDDGDFVVTGDITANDLNFTDESFNGHLLEVDENGSVNPVTTVVADKVRTTTINIGSSTPDIDYPISVLSANSEVIKIVGVDSTFTYNPSTQTLTVTNLNGLATNAVNANNATNADNLKTVSFADNNKSYAVSLVDTYSSGTNKKKYGADANFFTYNPSTQTLTVANLSGNASSATVSASSKVTRKSGSNDYPLALIGNTNPYNSSRDTTDETLAYAYYNSSYGVTFNPQTRTLKVGGGSGTIEGVVTNATNALNADKATNADNIKVGQYSSGEYPIPLLSILATEGYRAIGRDSGDSLTYNPNTNTLTIDNGNGTLNANVSNSLTADSATMAATATVSETAKVTRKSGNISYPLVLIGNDSPYDASEPTTDESLAYAYYNSAYGLKYNPYSCELSISNGNGTVDGTATNAKNVKYSRFSAISNEHPISMFATSDTSTNSGCRAIGFDNANSLTYNPDTKTLTINNGNGTVNAVVAKATNADKATDADNVHVSQFTLEGVYPIALFNMTTVSEGYKNMGTPSNNRLTYNMSTNTLNVNGGSGIINGIVSTATSAAVAEKVKAERKSGNINYPLALIGDSSPYDAEHSVTDESLVYAYYNSTYGVTYNPQTQTLTVGGGNGTVNGNVSHASNADNATTATSATSANTATVSNNVKATRKSGNVEYPLALIGNSSPYSSSEATTDESIAYGIYNNTYGVTYNPYSRTLTVDGGNGTINATVANATNASNAANSTNADNIKVGQYSSSGNYPIALLSTTATNGYRSVGRDSVDDLTYNPYTKTLTIDGGNGTVNATVSNATTADTATSASSADTADVSTKVKATRKSGNVSYPVALIGKSSPASTTNPTTDEEIAYGYYNSTYGLKFNPQSGELTVNGQPFRPITYSTSAPGSTLTTGTIWLQYEE